MRTALLSCLSSVGLAYLALGSHAALASDAPKICVNRYVSATVIDEILKGFDNGLKDAGISQANMVLQNPEADAATQQTLAQSFVSDACDVIVAISTPGAQAFKRATDSIPVVFIGSSTPVEAGLVESFDAPGGNFTGVADPAPVEGDIDAMLEVLPQMKTVGVVYKAGDPAGDFLAKRAIAHLERKGLVAIEATIANAGEATQSTQALVGRVDAIQIPGDSTTLSAMAAILKVADDAKLPVFGGLKEAVEQGGLLSASYSYEVVGYQAADLVKRVLQGENPATIPVIVPQASGFELNLSKAAKLGMDIPEDLKARASQTY